MISAIRPLLTETVEHWLAQTRTIHGKAIKSGSTPHPARVIRLEGEVVSRDTRERMPNARAVVWLIDHPRQVTMGDTFELPGGDALSVIGTETRTMPGGTLFKVFLT